MRDPYKPGSIRYWQAKYERHLAAVRNRAGALRQSVALENFLSRYQDRKTPDEIYVMDVADYRVARKNEGIVDWTIDVEVDAVRAFYTWLTDIQDVPTFNPAKNFKKRVLPSA